jgi:hypothetical protein
MRRAAFWVLMMRLAQKARQRQQEPGRMFRPDRVFSRTRRAAVKRSAIIATPRAARTAAQRARKGLLACAKASWRRCTTGSNHISAFGVWRDRARRGVTRINRTGETRWHRLPSTGQWAISEKGTS